MSRRPTPVERRTLTSLYDRGGGEIKPEDLVERMAQDGMLPDEEPPPRRRRYIFDEAADRYERWLERCFEG